MIVFLLRFVYICICIQIHIYIFVCICICMHWYLWKTHRHSTTTKWSIDSWILEEGNKSDIQCLARSPDLSPIGVTFVKTKSMCRTCWEDRLQVAMFYQISSKNPHLRYTRMLIASTKTELYSYWKLELVVVEHAFQLNGIIHSTG